MASYTTGANATSVKMGDFNGDGTTDLATADSSGVSVLLGQGNGTFSAGVSYATSAGSSPLSISTGDVNGDGVTDLVTADVNDDSVSILLGTTREGINPLLSFSLKNMADAKQALSMIQKKREQLSSQRGMIGALQARLSVGISTLTTKNENYLAAASRVRDIDVAQDAAEAVRLRILKETGTAILSQANQVPKLALTLLRS
jgi:flagellin-like hook-associated protein FlgL